MKWVMIRSLPFTHEFELEGNDRAVLKLSCRESEIMHNMRLIFGHNVEVKLFDDES